jgi:hypothetical protein
MASKNSAVRTTRRRLHALADVEIAVGALDEHLPSLARVIEERAFATEDDPQIIRITRAGMKDEGIDVGLRHIDDFDDSVVSALTGFTAPADWLAIGVSTGGNAYPVDEGRDARRRVRLVHIVTRTGASASVVRLSGDAPRLIIGAAGDTAVGRVDDVCRRALGLATSPPGSTIELFALWWFGAVMDLDADAPRDWDAVVALHPAVQVFVDSEPDLTTEASTRLVDLAELMARIVDWSSLRAEAAAGRNQVDSIPPRVARWLDDGAYSRWVLGMYPPLHELAAAVTELVPSSAARRLRSVLDAWGLGASPA